MKDTMDNTGNERKQTSFLKSSWKKIAVLAVCICFMIIGITVWNKTQAESEITGPSTLLGSEEIYPVVMVQDQRYEWRKGKAVVSELPENCTYYGEIVHAEGENPVNDCEFVSEFAVSGQIYTLAQDDSVVYLCLTTDWTENAVVAFDAVEY